MTIMSRNAWDQHDAFDIATGMEKAGATVISITYNGEFHQHGALIPASKFIVWARLEGNDFDRVDRFIDKQKNPNMELDEEEKPTQDQQTRGGV